MMKVIVRIGAITAMGAAVALFQAPSAQAFGEDLGAYLKRHHVKGERSKPVRHGRKGSRHGDGVYRIIEVEPNRGTRVYYAPVRHAPLGDQVRLTSGTWQYCEVTCEYTFRKYGPDFWDFQSEGDIYPRNLKFDFNLGR